jgi:hypothetical protein
MVFSQKSHEGYLMVDHRGSPGVPEASARRAGWEPVLVKKNSFSELKTLGCAHCNAVVIVNPLRTRERGHCYKCSRYICDYCTAAMRASDYQHRSFDELRDMVGSGKYTLTGPYRNPVLTPTGE